MIWFRSANSHRGRSSIAASEAGQMAASDDVRIFFKSRLHLAGRPQKRTRHKSETPLEGACALRFDSGFDELLRACVSPG